MTSVVGIPPLRPDLLSLGGNPVVVREEIEAIFHNAATNSPRSLQRAIGPSELGVGCDRKLAYKLAHAPEHNVRDPWRPTVGTAAHAWIAEALAAYNARTYPVNGFARYLIEQRVRVGDVNGVPIEGSADCYDRVTGEVIDWKVVGSTSLKNAKKAGPHRISKEQYRVQSHLYGRGFVLRGVPVVGVNVAYLPASGELRDAVWQREPYDEDVALQALARADALAKALDMAPPEAIIAGLTRADDMCTYCAYFDPAAKPAHVWDGCPGPDPGGRRVSKNESLVTELIGA